MIRNAVNSDIDTIEQIENASFNAPWSRVSIEAELYKDYAKFFIYEIDNSVAGYIIIWDLGKEWEVVTLAVAERFRRLGIGTKLLDYVVNLSGKNVEWRLEVACDNEAAINLYKKYGFDNMSIIKNYYGQGKNAYRMLRQIL